MFKIAATARFCERVLLDAGAPTGWSIDAVSVGDDVVQLLVQVPVGLSREDIPPQIKRAVTQALVRARIVSPWQRHVWDERHWCAVLTNASGVTAVRRHIHARSRLTLAGGLMVAEAGIPPSGQ
jgi:hypothetical protein